jgi:integral membrane protein
VYLLLTLDLARRVRMNVVVMLVVMAAGTIPFLSFVAERKVTAMVMGPQRRS